MSIQDLVSVIIPVHNGEQFLHENIRCVLNQTYKNLEVIYICDHCTDDTVPILKKYAANDHRLIVQVEKEKHGADISRNIGKDMASGEWIIFLDSDDLFEETMIEVLLREAVRQKADMCCCFWETFTDEGIRKSEITNKSLKLFCKTYPLIEVLNDRKYILQLVFYPPWTKLIHRSVYSKEQVYFQDIPNCDDVYFSLVAAMEAKKIVYVDQILVHYRIAQKRDTISSEQNDGKKKNYMWEAYDKVYQYICRTDDNEELKKSFYHRVCQGIFFLYGSGIYEKLYGQLRDVYFRKWDMEELDIHNDLSCMNRLIYTKICQGDQVLDEKCLMMEAKKEFIRETIKKSECSIWGCGNEGQKLLEALGNENEELRHIFDSDINKWGTYVAGRKIEKFQGEMLDSVVVTSSQYYEEIRKEIGKQVQHIYNLNEAIFLY